MSVDTKQAPRRELQYATFAELLADAERVVTTDAPTTGNWTKGQILEHLSRAIEGTIDGMPFAAPWPMRVMARVLFKNKFLREGLPPGFKLKKRQADHLVPDPISDADGLEHLRRAVARIETETHRAMHPFLGHLTREESDRFQLLHAQMHMSFIAEPNGG